ncbi:MAG: PD-(D/E)XK nuclease family protein [Proteobacteria bacterium]|nr:PD-(D/E)XK nuclease family protein [Pseudomonadota bacterium]
MELSILNNLKNKTTLITPSRRLAASARSLANQQFKECAITFTTPAIFALADWQKALWDQFEIEGLVNHLLLTPTQSLVLFEEILSNNESGKSLLRKHQAAKTALQAWDILNHWLCEDIIYNSTDNIDHRAFNAWSLDYVDWLKQHEAIDHSLLTKQLLILLESEHENIIKRVCETKSVILYGFEELSPLTSYFFQRLSASGWKIETLNPQAMARQSIMRKEFNDKEQEYAAAAHFANECLSQNQTLTIVVPNLADEKNALDKIFRDQLTPMHVLNPEHEVCSFFNISAATPLNQYPLIANMLSLLKLAFMPCSIKEVGKVVTSAFIREANSASFGRAIFVECLKKRAQDFLQLEEVLGLLTEDEKADDSILKSLLTSIHYKAKAQPQKQSLYAWVSVYREILSIVGWPGERNLNSVEYQLVNRIDSLFNEFVTLDMVLKPQDAASALSQLQKVIANIPFQAENKGAPIQVLGLLEAAGQTFENLWVMGMDSDAWPPVCTPNPFIPIELQRQHKMPHASAEREMEYALKVTSRFKQSAKHIVFSYTVKDGKAHSELIEEIPCQQAQELIQINRCELLFSAKENLESFVDEKGPSLENEDAFKGTVSTLYQQAICPFRAFAEQRLALKPVQAKSLWIQSDKLGSLLHSVLEEFWRTFESQEKLLSFSPAEVTTKIKAWIDKHLAKVISKQTPLTYLQAEKNRLLTILLAYVELEKQRVPFKVIAIEEKRHFNLSKINFSIRLDRVDQNNLGEHVIVDYKSGQFSINALFGERIEAVQLPLYFCASYTDYHPKALMAIKLNAKACEFEGVSENESDIPGVEALTNINTAMEAITWRALNQYWTDKLTLLAQEFSEGIAKVAPMYAKTTCQYCHLSALCRVNELGVENA